VRIGKPPNGGSGPGSVASVVHAVPSALDWSCPRGGVAPKKPAPGAIAIEKAWARNGCAKSNRTHAGLPPSGSGSEKVFE
jgi:hypothetical protein